MKSFAYSVFAAGLMLTGMNSVLAAQASDAWREQWFKAKYGRNSPMEEARLAAERRRADPEATKSSAHSSPTSNQRQEQWFKAKFGRNTPAEEARLAAARAEQPAAAVAKASDSRNDWFAQWYKAKHGRYSPREEARRKTER